MAAPSSTNIHVFSDIFAKIDQLLLTFVNDTSARAIAAITPIVATCLAIWLIWHAYNVMMGHSRMPVADLIQRCLLWSIVMSVALTVGNYQSDIGNIVRTLPNDAAASLIEAGTPNDNQLGAVLDKTADIGIDKAKQFWNEPTSTLDFSKAIILGAAGIGILISTLILCIAGFFMLALATVTISFLAALGPFFIAALMFDSTRNFFWSWLSHVAYWVMFLVLFALMVTFVVSVYQFYANAIKMDDTGYSWVSALFACNVVAVFGMVFFFHIPRVASGLTGGSGHTTLGAVGSFVRTVVATVVAMKTLGISGAASGSSGSAGAAGQASRGAASVAASTSAPPREYNRGRAA